MSIRIDWEWADGSCNYAVAEDDNDADTTIDWLRLQAERMDTSVRIWIDQELFEDYQP